MCLPEIDFGAHLLNLNRLDLHPRSSWDGSWCGTFTELEFDRYDHHARAQKHGATTLSFPASHLW